MGKGRATTDQIQVVLNSLAGAGVDIASRPNMASVVWDLVSGTYKHVVITGEKGDAGREIELQKSATHIQMRYVGVSTWTNIVPLADITGPAGPNMVQTGTVTNINGLLKGDGSGILRAVPGEDYVVPTDPRFSNLGTTTLTYPLELSETILKGKAVQLLTNGKIEGIKEISVSQAIPAGTLNNFWTNTLGQNTTHKVKVDTFNPNRLLILRCGNTTVHGAIGYINHTTNAITVGAFSSLNVESSSSAYVQFDLDPFVQNRFVVTTYSSTSGYSYIYNCTMANDTPSQSGYTILTSCSSTISPICFDKRIANRLLVLCKNTSGYPIVYALTLSGSTVSAGTGLQLQTTACTLKGIASNPLLDNSFLVTYMKNSNIYCYVDHINITVTTCTRSSTMYLPFGSMESEIAFNPNSKNDFLMVVANNANGNYGTVIKGKLSDTLTVSFGSNYVFCSASIYNETLAGSMLYFDPVNKDRFSLNYNDPLVGNVVTVQRGTITGEVISFGTKVAISGNPTPRADQHCFAHFPSYEGKFVYMYWPNTTNVPWYIAVGQFPCISTNLDKTRVLGILQKDGDVTNVRDVLVSGIDETQTGLEIGQKYYAMQNGTISKTPVSNSAPLGIALSTTKLLIKTI